MIAYMKEHEARMRVALDTAGEGFDWASLAEYHRHRIGRFQHERIAHLLVMLFVGLFTLLSFFVFMSHPDRGMGLLVLLFLVLLIAYIAHYFRLENGVQRLYRLADEIERREGEASSQDPALSS